MEAAWHLVTRPQAPTILELAATAAERLIVVSPFVSHHAASELLAATHVEAGVKFELLTAATAASLLAGTCDAEALALIAERGGVGGVHRLPLLHAKVYIADSRLALVTSANLTRGGFRANYEDGALISAPSVVGSIVEDVKQYLRVATFLSGQAISEVQSLLARAARQAPRPADTQLQRYVEAVDDLFVAQHVTGRTEHEVFGNAILYVLRRDGPLSTRELHPRIQALHPELCDDTRDRIIDGRSFGKRWKHQVRNAQQHLKGKGLITLSDGVWSSTS